MKRELTYLFLLVACCVATPTFGRAQGILVTNPGWYPAGAYDMQTTSDPTAGDDPELLSINIQQTLSPTQPSIAEVITPQLQALADGLERDPARIFNYVHDHIRYVLYFGAKKGAQLTLLEKSGNDFDQCALLVALLRAAGHTNAAYQFGWMVVPFDNPDGTHRDLHHWLGLNFTNTNWNDTRYYLQTLFSFWRSYPTDAIASYSDCGNNQFAFQRVWVKLSVGGTNYLLDPAFKVSEPIVGVSLSAAMGSTKAAMSNALMTAAGGVDFGSFSTNFYTTNLNETALSGTLLQNTTNLLNYIQTSRPNASVEEVVSGQYIVPSTDTNLSSALLFPTTNMNGTMPTIDWVNLPTNLMSTLKITFGEGNKTYQWFMPQLHGERLSLVYSSTSVRLWQEDTSLATGTISVADPVTLTATHPRGNWNSASNTYTPGGGYVVSVGTTYLSNATYAIMYAFEPDWGWLQDRQKRLQNYRQQGLADSSREVLTETLNVMGLNWLLQTEYLGRMLAGQIGVLPMYYQRIGRMAQETGRGYYVDVYMQTAASPTSAGQGCTAACDVNSKKFMDLGLFFGSAMEHGMIEQLQASNLVAASMVKMLNYANNNHQAIYLVSSTNWNVVKNKLSNYVLSDLQALTDAGYQLLLPQNGSFAVSGSGTRKWTGFGFLARKADGSVGQALIGQGKFGGYAGDLDATVNPGFIDYSGYSQPIFFDSAPASVPHFTGADPIDMANGTFQLEGTDLTLGQKEPRGLTFSRYYNSNRRTSNLAGISAGWLHNYYINAALVSAPQAQLGGTTPAQAAAMLAATASAISLYDGDHPDPKNWMVTALIAKWAVDQLTAKAVSISLGEASIQFIQQPDGRYSSPANSTMTLSQLNGAYKLQERHGRTFQFDAGGRGTNIVDQYNRRLKISYTTNSQVDTVTDWTNRSLQFTYSSAAPKRLVSVSDSTGRSVGFGYSGVYDLNSVSDTEHKTNTFLYDTNHQIVSTRDALNQLVVSNIYDGFGRVTTQYTQGDTNKIWQIYWSGWETVAQDPAGGKQRHFYDNKTREIGQQDELGNLGLTYYDGQDHVVMTVSPMLETNSWLYDDNHNVVTTIDPLGFSNQFLFDDDNRLLASIDQRGNTNFFGYNTQYSLTAITNAAGDWTTFTYYNDGTLSGRTDPDGTLTYNYDSFGQLKQIIYPAGLGSEGFSNSVAGDVLSFTNGRGFVTTFQYNSRRQVTNTVAPTNLTAKITYDAVGNRKLVTDPRGYTTTSFWSPTRRQTGTVFPPTPQGSPAVTNYYDARDWLFKTVINPGGALSASTTSTNDLGHRQLSVTDALQRTTIFGYDADGRKVTITNSALEVVGQKLNARGELFEYTDPGSKCARGSFDGAGNQTSVTNRRGKGWTFSFDKANRLVCATTPLGRTNALVFDKSGLLRTNIDSMGRQTIYIYDAKGRRTFRSDAAGSNSYGYDDNNNIIYVTQSGATNSWAYDAYDRVSTYTDAEGNVIRYGYDANGNVTSLVYPGGKAVSYFYDSLNRLTNVTDWANRVTSIAYDLASRVKSVTRFNNTIRLINYDLIGEVTNIVEKGANNFPLTFSTLGWRDPGRISWEFNAPLPSTNSPLSRIMTYDDDNQLSTFNGQNVVYDDNGNMTLGPLTNSFITAYSYDARNRLIGAGGLDYGYDPAGSRTSITNGASAVRFTVNPNSAIPQVLIRTKPDGTKTFYVYGLGLLYEANFSADGTELNTRTYHYDVRGSTVCITDQSGLPVDRIGYSVYGATTFRIGTTDTPFLYNGRYGVMTDTNGLLYMQARYYNPNVCRFINADPAGFGTGLNRYAYANGNPVSMADPFGLGALEAARGNSWSDQLLNGLGIDNGFAAQERRQEAIISGANLVSLGFAEDISSALFGRTLEGTSVGGVQRGLAVISVATAAMPFLRVESAATRFTLEIGEASADIAAELTVGSGTQLDVRPAAIVRQINDGERVSGLIDELKQLTFQSRSAESPYGLEHGIISQTDGTRWIVSGGQDGINFSGISNFRNLIAHTHGIPTGPSIPDFWFLANSGQWSSRIVELGNPNVIKFMRAYPIN